MDELWPNPTPDIDVTERIAAERRVRPDGRPWVTLLMISSLDGAAALDGVSGPLGAPADKQVFGALRSRCDAIVVGAGTVRAENYGPVPRRADAVIAARLSRGQAERPELAVISGSLNFPTDGRLFEDPAAPPVILHPTTAPDDRRTTLADRAVLVDSGEDRVEPSRVVDALGARGHRMLLLEGGPSLNAQFLAAGMIDEIHLSLAPIAVGGEARRIIDGMPASPAQGFALSRVWAGDGLLFLRYLADPDGRGRNGTNGA